MVLGVVPNVLYYVLFIYPLNKRYGGDLSSTSSATTYIRGAEHLIDPVRDSPPTRVACYRVTKV